MGEPIERQAFVHRLDLLAEHGLPERAFDPLFDAASGHRVRRSTYVKRSGLELRTATRDLKALTDAGLLAARGETRGRSYVAAGDVADLHAATREHRTPLADPYPDLMQRINAEAAE